MSLRSWPPTRHELRQWDPTAGIGSRRDRAAHSGPYEAALPPSIASVDVNLPSDVLADADEASSQLARFDATLAAAGVQPMAAVLLRTESAASSLIEQIPANPRALARAATGLSSSTSAMQAARNVAAMEAAIDGEGPIALDHVQRIHRVLMEADPHHRPGIRTQQVWIGGSSLGPHRAAFVPPHHDRLDAALTDWVEFAQRLDIPAFVHAALAHAQFETIHPFTDGNGRTGRALVHAMLKSAGLLAHAAVPLSAGLVSQGPRYIEALESYRRGDAAAIVSVFADSALGAVRHTGTLVEDLASIRDDWTASLGARKGAAVLRLLDVMVAQPVLTAERAAHALEVPLQSAYRAIDAAVAAGALVQVSAGARNRVWEAPAVLEALSAFEYRMGAPTGRTG